MKVSPFHVLQQHKIAADARRLVRLVQEPNPDPEALREFSRLYIRNPKDSWDPIVYFIGQSFMNRGTRVHDIWEAVTALYDKYSLRSLQALQKCYDLVKSGQPVKTTINSIVAKINFRMNSGFIATARPSIDWKHFPVIFEFLARSELHKPQLGLALGLTLSVPRYPGIDRESGIAMLFHPASKAFAGWSVERGQREINLRKNEIEVEGWVSLLEDLQDKSANLRSLL